MLAIYEELIYVSRNLSFRPYFIQVFRTNVVSFKKIKDSKTNDHGTPGHPMLIYDIICCKVYL